MNFFTKCIFLKDRFPKGLSLSHLRQRTPTFLDCQHNRKSGPESVRQCICQARVPRMTVRPRWRAVVSDCGGGLCCQTENSGGGCTCSLWPRLGQLPVAGPRDVWKSQTVRGLKPRRIEDKKHPARLLSGQTLRQSIHQLTRLQRMSGKHKKKQIADQGFRTLDVKILIFRY